MSTDPEFWLSGPVEGVPALLQPVAHALLQVNREIQEIMEDFPENRLWERPGGVASAAFHLEHIPGVIDRLKTYAEGNLLNEIQMEYLKQEGFERKDKTKEVLCKKLEVKIKETINWIKTIDPGSLTEARYVGRKKIPTSLIGLLFHSAEHSMRHTRQLLVTAKILKES